MLRNSTKKYVNNAERTKEKLFQYQLNHLGYHCYIAKSVKSHKKVGKSKQD